MDAQHIGAERNSLPHQDTSFSDAEADVVVIGSGVAGLTAAALLAKAGLRVSLFEQDAQAGGYLASFQRGDYRFDTSVQWLNQFRPRGFTYRIHHYLGDDGPLYPRLNRVHRYKGSGYDYLLTTDPLQLRDQLVLDFPSETVGLHAIFRDAQQLGRHLLCLDDRMRAACTMTFAEKVHHALAMMRWVWPIRHYAATSAKKGLRRYFKAPILLDLFYSQDSLMSVLVPIALAFTGDFQALPQGGGKAVVEWLSSAIKRNGGMIHLRSPVSRIVVDGDKTARGVQLATGQIIRSKYVVCACDSTHLFTRMVPDPASFERWARRMNQAELYHSSFSIYLGLDCPPEQLGLNEELVHLVASDAPPEARISGLPETTTISLFAPSFRDPSSAPAGKGTLQVQCPAYLAYQDNWKTEAGLVRGEAYQQLKNEYAGVLLDRVEKNLIPDLRQHITEMNVATPVTFLRYTSNRDGGIMGLRPTPKNIRAGLAQLTTPIKHLLLGSQWASYGGGVPIATKSAVNASLLILRDLRPDAFQDLKDLVDGKSTARGRM